MVNGGMAIIAPGMAMLVPAVAGDGFAAEAVDGTPADAVAGVPDAGIAKGILYAGKGKAVTLGHTADEPELEGIARDAVAALGSGVAIEMSGFSAKTMRAGN